MGKLSDSESGSINLSNAAKVALSESWRSVGASAFSVSPEIPAEILGRVDRSINSSVKTYRYVLPTQLAAKVADARLDCRSVQATWGKPGAFDARSICDDVVVPFDRATENVLGGSAEPYANNPLRIPAITPEARAAQRNKDGFDDLCVVLDYAQAHPDRVRELLDVVMFAVLNRLSTTRVVYPAPNRASLWATLDAVNSFLGTRSGGLRMQVVTVALFRCIGQHYGLYKKVRSNNINAADAATGSAADLECVTESGQIALAIEVKDRRLAIRHAQDKIPAIREKGITETLFLVSDGVEPSDDSAMKELIERQFASGQNIYVADFISFLEKHMMMLGEAGRRRFLILVGEELETRRSDVVHRKEWRDLLAKI